MPDTDCYITSSFSGTGNCVEVMATPTGTWVRDTKDRSRQPLAFSSTSWSAFLAEVRSGRFDAVR